MTPALLRQPYWVTVRCRTDRRPDAPAHRHRVRVAVDGCLDTGHDLPAERLAVALGGYLSCLELVDTAGPALLAWLRMRHRLGPMPITSRSHGKRWTALLPARCCPTTGFDSPVAAGRHARSTTHVAKVFGADPRQLAALARPALELTPHGPDDEPWRQVWECGLQPAELAGIDAELGVDEPLSLGFYLAVQIHRPDVAWLRACLPYVDLHSDRPEWLAWSYGPRDRDHPAARVGWLRLGVLPRCIDTLLGAGYTAAEVGSVADHWMLSAAQTALILQDWVAADMRPTVTDMTGPAAQLHGFPPRPPGAASRDRLRAELGPGGAGRSELSLAMALIAHGDVSHAARALRSG